MIRGGFFHLYNSLTFLIFVPRIQRGACHVPIQYVPQAEIIPILPDTDNAGEGNCKTWYTSARIADTCPGVRSHDDGRGLGDEIGDTLAIVFAAEFVFGYFAVSHRSTFGYFGGGDDYFVQR